MHCKSLRSDIQKSSLSRGIDILQSKMHEKWEFTPTEDVEACSSVPHLIV